MSSNMRIHDMPEKERPRELLLLRGANMLPSSYLVAILLRTGLKGRSVIAVAEELLKKYNTLDNLSRATHEELRAVKGIGRDKAATLLAAFTLARRMAEELRRDAPECDRPEAVANLLREDCRQLTVEQFFILLLNTRRRLIKLETISQGTLDTLLVHPREVFRHAITANASAVVLAHNHPSGDPLPSEGDIKTTRDLIRAGQLLKIEVLDHVILGRKTSDTDKGYVSLRELGYFYS